MGFKTWGSETLTASDLNNYLMKQANTRTTVGSEPTGEQGMKVMLTDKDQERVYNGSTWVRTGWWSGTGRTGCIIERSTTQSIAGQTFVAVQFNSEVSDSDGFYPGSGGTITIPTGCGGLYVAQIQTNWSAGVGSLGGKINFQRNGTDLYIHTMPAGTDGDCATYSPVALSAGDTIVIRVYQSNTGALNLTSRLEFFRIGA